MLTTYSLSGLTVVTPDSRAAGQQHPGRPEEAGTPGREEQVRPSLRGRVCRVPRSDQYPRSLQRQLPAEGRPPARASSTSTGRTGRGTCKNSDVIKSGARASTSVEERYFLSAYKNIFSGRRHRERPFPPRMERALHSPASHAGHPELHPRRTPVPPSTCAGATASKSSTRGRRSTTSPSSRTWRRDSTRKRRRGIETLEAAGCLDDHTIMIHCIGFSDEDIQKVGKAGAHVAWCANSNIFMFNVTCKIRKMLEAGINVSIGTDSTATGSVNLLEEMRYDRETYRSMYGEDIAARRRSSTW